MANDRPEIDLTVPALLRHAVQQWPQRVLLRTRTGAQTTDRSYAQVGTAVSVFARDLAARGIRPGDSVALWSENSAEWVIAYLAVLCSGAVAVPLDALSGVAEVVHVLERSRARLLLISPKLNAALAESGAPLPCPLRLLAPADSVPPNLDSMPELPRARPEDLAVILFTSGTTGFAKGVMLTHRNLVSDAVGSASRLTIYAHDNLLLLLPLHHTYSSTVNVLVTICGGARATLATSYKSRDILDDIRIGAVTIVPGVPQIYENLMLAIQRSLQATAPAKRWLAKLFMTMARMGAPLRLAPGKLLFRTLRNRAGLSNVRLFVSGGAALRPEVNCFFRDLGFDLVQGYGLTETSPVLSFNPPTANRIGSVGLPINGAELRIDNPDGHGIGEICARGPMVMRGYYEDDQTTSQVLRDGWLRTGDAGYIDSRGYLHITGRIKNVIVTSGGKNIYPEEIEARLDFSPFILESVVLGIERQKGGGEELGALIVPDAAAVAAAREAGIEVDVESEIKQTVDAYNATVPVYRQLRHWRIRDTEFEKTSLRKIRRFKYKSLD